MGNPIVDAGIHAIGGCLRGQATGGSCSAGARNAVLHDAFTQAGQRLASMTLEYMNSGNTPRAMFGAADSSNLEPEGVTDGVTPNPELRGSVFRYESGDQRWIMIDVAMRPEGSHTEAAQYADSISRALTTRVDGGGNWGIDTYNVVVSVVLTTDRASFALTPCTFAVCQNWGGVANNERIWYWSNQMSPALAGHEFMHVLGFMHQPNSTLSITSYSFASSRYGYYWTLTTSDVERLWRAYK
jgi:hypothetical protein